MSVDAEGNRAEKVAWLLEDNIRTELAVHNALGALGLSEEAIRDMAGCIATEILYAFDVDWAPDWVGCDEVHFWEHDGAYFARCGVCLADSPPHDDTATALAWAKDHERAHTP